MVILFFFFFFEHTQRPKHKIRKAEITKELILAAHEGASCSKLNSDFNFLLFFLFFFLLGLQWKMPAGPWPSPGGAQNLVYFSGEFTFHARI